MQWGGGRRSFTTGSSRTPTVGSRFPPANGSQLYAPFIDALLRNHIVFQAEHQHFYDLEPPTWFIHFRVVGDPLTIGRGVHAEMKATSVKLPQTPPAHPHTPFNVGRLKRIVGCLYNHETAETPQLYFSHDFKTGNPYQVAQEIRDALDEMSVT